MIRDELEIKDLTVAAKVDRDKEIRIEIDGVPEWLTRDECLRLIEHLQYVCDGSPDEGDKS